MSRRGRGIVVARDGLSSLRGAGGRVRAKGGAALAGALGLALVLGGCSDPAPVLLDEADFPGATVVHQPSEQAPSWVDCPELAGIGGERVAGTYLSFGSAGDTIIASLIDGSADVAENPDFLLTPERIAAWEAEHGRIPAGHRSGNKNGRQMPRNRAYRRRAIRGAGLRSRRCFRDVDLSWL